jgi:hypothetical protein
LEQKKVKNSKGAGMSTLHGQGATPERKQKTKLTTGVRETNKGGIPTAYGDIDTEHCALDVLFNEGYIDKDQRDSGYRLRQIYYTWKHESNEIDKGGKAYEGDFETETDRAREAYNQAMKAVDKPYRNITHHISIEASTVDRRVVMYGVMQDILHGLDDLTKHFESLFRKRLR